MGLSGTEKIVKSEVITKIKADMSTYHSHAALLEDNQLASV